MHMANFTKNREILRQCSGEIKMKEYQKFNQPWFVAEVKSAIKHRERQRGNPFSRI